MPPMRGPERTTVLFPAGDFYPPHIAGPHQRGNAVTLATLPQITAADSGETAFGLRLGGVFGILRRHPDERPDRGWQIGIEAGFYGQFDVDESFDNLGWDGFYGLAYTRSLGPRLGLKVGALHTSSHVGDEYAERTGRQRINYTREELLVGLDWAFRQRWRTYGELAFGYERRNEDLQEPGRAEWGLEYEANDSLWKKRLGWYVALDLNAFEERDWEPDVALQIGVHARPDTRRWRFGLEYYDGRIPLGEFFFEDQEYIGFGLYTDFGARRID